jgi:hypothetical protein
MTSRGNEWPQLPASHSSRVRVEYTNIIGGIRSCRGFREGIRIPHHVVHPMLEGGGGGGKVSFTSGFSVTSVFLFLPLFDAS